MTELWLVRRRRAGPWDWSRGLRSQEGWDEHADIMERWVDEGFILLGGPIEDENGPEVVHVIDAPAARSVEPQLMEPILSSVIAKFVRSTLPVFVTR